MAYRYLLQTLMSKTIVNRTISMPSVAENRKIMRAAKADPDALPLTNKQLKEMVPYRTLRDRSKSGSKKRSFAHFSVISERQA
jgi:hypothetical protein